METLSVSHLRATLVRLLSCECDLRYEIIWCWCDPFSDSPFSIQFNCNFVYFSSLNLRAVPLPWVLYTLKGPLFLRPFAFVRDMMHQTVIRKALAWAFGTIPSMNPHGKSADPHMTISHRPMAATNDNDVEICVFQFHWCIYYVNISIAISSALCELAHLETNRNDYVQILTDALCCFQSNEFQFPSDADE